MKSCEVENCTNKYYAKGYCARHYHQVLRVGYVLERTMHEFNEIVDKGNYYEIIINNCDRKEVGRAKIDKEDLEKVQAVGRWHFNEEGYAANNGDRVNGARKNGKNAKTVYMHNIVMDMEEVNKVDHIKTGLKNRSDNRKKNLRLCNQYQNARNKGLNVTNTSGYKGVDFNKASGKWRARICVENKSKSLGYFNTPEEAHTAYCKASRKYHKEFGRTV